MTAKNILIDYRYAEGKPERLNALAAELLQLNVDIIVAAGGSPPAQAAKDNATKTIPIVMTNPAHAVGDGLKPPAWPTPAVMLPASARLRRS